VRFKLLSAQRVVRRLNSGIATNAIVNGKESGLVVLNKKELYKASITADDNLSEWTIHDLSSIDKKCRLLLKLNIIVIIKEMEEIYHKLKKTGKDPPFTGIFSIFWTNIRKLSLKIS